MALNILEVLPLTTKFLPSKPIRVILLYRVNLQAPKVTILMVLTFTEQLVLQVKPDIYKFYLSQDQFKSLATEVPPQQVELVIPAGGISILVHRLITVGSLRVT